MTGLTGNLANILASIVGSNKVPDDELRQRSDVATPTGTDANGLESFQVSRPQEGQVQQAQPQAQSQSSPAEPKGSSFDAKQLLELLPIFAASAELFNPFAKGGGPVSLGSKIGDAISSGLDTQKSISGIRALEAKTKASRLGKNTFKKRKGFKGGISGEFQEVRDSAQNVIESEFVPDKSKFISGSTNTASFITELGPDGKVVRTINVADKGLSKKTSLELNKANAKLLNNITELEGLSKRLSDPNKPQDLAGPFGAFNRMKEFAVSVFTGKPLPKGSATKFNIELQALVAQSASDILNQPSAKIGDKDLAFLKQIISNEAVQSEPEVQAQLDNVVAVLRRVAEANEAGLSDSSDTSPGALNKREDAQRGIVGVGSNREANALPPGTKFRLPNGRVGVR